MWFSRSYYTISRWTEVSLIEMNHLNTDKMQSYAHVKEGTLYGVPAVLNW